MIIKKLTFSKAHYPDFLGPVSTASAHHLCRLKLPAHTDNWSTQVDVAVEECKWAPGSHDTVQRLWE